jgi:hypothetical protein
MLFRTDFTLLSDKNFQAVVLSRDKRSKGSQGNYVQMKNFSTLADENFQAAPPKNKRSKRSQKDFIKMRNSLINMVIFTLKRSLFLFALTLNFLMLIL